MTSKERAALRARANSLEPLFQVGKGGINDALITQTDDALRARELIKLKVLTETSPVGVRDAAEELAAKTGADVVQVIGGVMVLYRYNKELHESKRKKEPRQVKAVGKETRENRTKKLFRDKVKKK